LGFTLECVSNANLIPYWRLWVGIVDEHLSQLLLGTSSAEPGLMAIFDDLHVGVALLDEQLRYRYLNQTALRVVHPAIGKNPLGCSVEELVRGAYEGERAKDILGIFKRVLETGQPHHQKACPLA
jgi:PAS domain-containing protein